jgi:hypothetical protein
VQQANQAYTDEVNDDDLNHHDVLLHKKCTKSCGGGWDVFINRPEY